MLEILEKRLVKQAENGLYRQLENKKSQIDFASNDYLGFARSEELKEHISEAFSKLVGLGATGSRLLTGNSRLCEEIEEEIAGDQSGLLFNSGYSANLGVISSLASKGDTILFDKQVHASTRDGIRLSFAPHFGWQHNDLNDLERLLKKYPKSLVLAESIYSTDGSEAPLELYDLCTRYGASLIMDEAHAFGIFPPRKAFANIYMFGKALGVAGAIVVGPNALKKYLINFSRPLIYSTALPLYSLVAIREAYRYLKNSQHLVRKLHALMAFSGQKTHIRRVNAKNEEKLREHGIAVSYLRPPTVATDCFRIALHSYNNEEEIRTLCQLLL